jgi:hypothetical protein
MRRADGVDRVGSDGLDHLPVVGEPLVDPEPVANLL